LGFAAFDTVGAFLFLPVAGLAMAVGQTLYSAYINERSPSSQRATILSFQQLVMSLSMAALVPLAGALGDRAGLQAGYALIMGLVGVAAAAGVLLWLRAQRGGDAPPMPDQSLAEPETVPAG
jgi:MFS family permease